MREITYKVTSRGAFVCEVDTKNEHTVAFKLLGEDEGILKIGEKTYEISHGVCYIDLSEIKDGIYTPELVCDSGTFKLERVSIFFGVMKLKVGEVELARASREILELSSRLAHIEGECKRLLDAVFGTKIF